MPFTACILRKDSSVVANGNPIFKLTPALGEEFVIQLGAEEVKVVVRHVAQHIRGGEPPKEPGAQTVDRKRASHPTCLWSSAPDVGPGHQLVDA